MILAAHQPQFMPWLGYFDKIARCDVFVLMDDVQFKKNEWQNRNRIKTARGPRWLTVPVLHRFGQTLRETRINEQDPWRRKNARSLEQAYGGAAHVSKYADFLAEVHGRAWGSLADLNAFCVGRMCGFLGLGTPLRLSSEMGVPGKASERLLNLCRAVGADTYLSGAGGKDYLDQSLFREAGVRVIFQNFVHPSYAQLHGGFEENLSALDLLLNEGPRGADVLRGAK